MFIPPEILGTFYRFRHVDLMERLIGGPGVSCLYWDDVLQITNPQIQKKPVTQLILRLFKSSGPTNSQRSGFATIRSCRSR